MWFTGVILIVGVLLILAGRRGLLSGFHPHCRKCEFDLFGLPPDTPRCPECGADIQRDDSMQIGRRRPVRTAIGMGAVLLLGALILLVVQGVSWWPQFDGAPYKPFVWLEADLHSADQGTRVRSASELLRRIRSRELSPGQVDKVADFLLHEQADTSAPWRMRWGDLLQAGHSAGLLSPERWQRYLAQSLQVEVRVRPRVEAGSPVPFAVTCRLRAGTDYQAIAPATVAPRVTVALGSLSSEVPIHAAPLDTIPAPIEWTALWMPPPDAAWPSPGRQSLDVAIVVTLTDRNGVAAASTHRVAVPFDLVDRGVTPITPQHSAELSAEMEPRVVYSGARTNPRLGAIAVLLPPTATSGGATWGGVNLGRLTVGGPPIAAAFRVVLRQEGHEWSLARFLVKPNDAATIPLTLRNTEINDLHPGPAEIVCLPDPELAAGTVDVMEVWWGEIHRPFTLVTPNPPLNPLP